LERAFVEVPSLGLGIDARQRNLNESSITSGLNEEYAAFSRGDLWGECSVLRWDISCLILLSEINWL
jgi:hypothetical protein